MIAVLASVMAPTAGAARARSKAAGRGHTVKFFWEVFVTLFVVVDPLGNVPLFLGLTSDRSGRERNRLAWQATLVALEGAGGLLLLLVALELLTGRATEPTPAEVKRANVAFVPLGTPLLAGPGAIAATMLFVQRVHGVGDGFAVAGPWQASPS